ncbi:uncharacterized protein LOC122946519 isoform X1 [Bufo gargarizans]|uniref:uncharacterized protein LOC122946519 isoform X1 n=1 Tax=Bufo gargarizans TaxID=30331 RepID=UPI001CF18565|nr:uncharacterized protein LOC122946519 isoform X1 [Bufo gargarizans]
MDQDNQKPIHPGIHPNGVQDRVSPSSSSSIPDHSLSIDLSAGPAPEGHPKTSDFRRNCTSPSFRGVQRSLLKTLPHHKTRWLQENHHQSEISEQMDNTSSFQDGINKIGNSVDKPRGVPMHPGSKGRILSRPHSPSLSAIFEVRNQEGRKDYAFPVPMSPVWNFISPTHLHKGSGGDSCLSKTETGNYSPLPRRLSACGRLRGGVRASQRKDSIFTHSSRMENKPGEIGPTTSNAKEVPRNPPKFRDPVLSSSPRQAGQHKGKNKSLQTKEKTDSAGSHAGPRTDDLMHHNCSLGPVPYKNPPGGGPRFLGQGPQITKHQGISFRRGGKLPLLVVGNRKPVPRSCLEHDTAQNINHGRKQPWLGSPPRGPVLSGQLVRRRRPKILKLQGIESGLGVPKSGRTSPHRSSCPSAIGQRNNSLLHKKTRRDEESSSPGPSESHLQLVRGEDLVHFSHTPEGISQLHSGLSQPTISQARGMEVEPGGIPNDLPTVGETSSGFICVQQKYSAGLFLLARPKRRTTGGGCSFPTLGYEPSLRFSPTSPHTANPEEIERVLIHADLGSSSLAQESLVFGSKDHVHQGTNNPSKKTRPTITRSSVSPQPGQTEPYSVDPERQTLRNKGLSDKVISTLQSCRKPITRAIYNKIWKKFSSWLSQNQADARSPTVGCILEFLQEGFDAGLKPSTLKVQVSALSCCLDTPLADHRWIRSFLKAASRLRPTLRQSVPPWSLNVVLEGLCDPPFEPIGQISEKFLSLKAVFLLAITTARRIGEIQALSIKQPYLRILDDRIILKPDPAFLPKVVSAFHREQELTLPSFCSLPKNIQEERFQRLDVRRAILAYLDRTSSWRRSSNLFIQFGGKNRGLKASKQTLARWIKDTIRETYRLQEIACPLNLKAHSTRAMATSWAERADATIDQICKAATWYSFLTFAKHYRLDVLAGQDLAFGRKVLQAVVPP